MLHFQIIHIATILIVAFFVFFAAQKADGIVSLFGNLLGALLLVGAVLHIVAIFAPGVLGLKPGAFHDGLRGHWAHHFDAQPAPAAAPAAPAKPSLAPPASTPAPAPKKS